MMNKQIGLANDKLPQFYRQRFLIAMVQVFKNKLTKTDLMKFLFLYNQLYKEAKKDFDFVPYRYGPFSFQAYADIRRLSELGLITEEDCVTNNTTKSYLSLLSKLDQTYLREFYQSYRTLSGDNLIRYIYSKYPYYARKSEIRERIGNSLLKDTAIDYMNVEAIYSLGYEGISIDAYLNTLVRMDIKTVIDVRKNPISMKYGFSKKTLEKALDALDVKYLHLPELGIESKERQELSSLESYNKLFDSYEKEVLSQSDGYVQKIVSEFKVQKRVVLTCFEKSHLYCHRSRICNLIESRYGLPIKHL
jgi:uncharacterized protein (DUF488 family)